jgi:hypothetical protein
LGRFSYSLDLGVLRKAYSNQLITVLEVKCTEHSETNKKFI